MRNLWTLLRAGGALAALLTVVGGVPWALARVAGWPLPTTWPRLERLPDVLRDGLSDGFWIKALALVVWVAWAQVAAAVVVELVARMRGRSTDRRRGLGWAQAVAGQLVGALAVAGGLVGSAPHAVAAPVPSLASSLIAVAGAAPAARPSTAPVVVTARATHVVVPGETLSSIARDELGHAADWPALWDANRGRAFGERVFDNPNLILPGWDLTVPQRAMLLPPLVLSAADEHVPAGPMPVVTPAALPPAPTRAMPPAAPTLDPAATTGATPTAAVAPRAGAAPVAPEDVVGGIPVWTRLGVLLGATLLATGAAGMIASARRRSLRASAPTSTVVVPEPEVAEVVAALHAGSDALAMARLELALRSLGGQLARSRSEAQPVAVRRRDDVLEVVLDRVAGLVAPWAPGRGDRTWELPAAVALTDLTDDARAVAPPCPALVGVGRDGDGHEVYVDLEAVTSVRVEADASRLVAATLAVTPLADSLRLLVVGDDLPLPSGRHQVRHVPDVGAALAEADALTSAVAQAGAPSTFRLRSVAGHESWEPVIIVLAAPVTDEEAAELRSLAAGRRGVVVVGVDLPDADLDLTPGGDGWVRVADWSVWPHGIDRPVAEAILAAVDAPLVVEDVPSEESVADDAPAVDARRPWTLMVRVLGPVDVVDAQGRQAEFERAKALELVTWLAQHPQSATRAGARAALWAIDVANASFSNVVSEARRALARLASPPDGGDWVARTYAERLPLHPEVVLDADLVRRHLDQARRLPDPDAIEELRRALELVRGAPYAGRSYLWPDAEALPSTLTLLVTTVAAELGRRLLHAGDLDGVFAATAVGLDVLPGHEELIALRLRAHAQRGDRSALHREYMSYEHAVLADPWDGEPSPTLVALRRELLQPVAGE
jgi:hypothetical protein